MDTAHGIKSLGMFLRNARKSKDWTQGDVAERTGLSVGYISNTEKGYVNPKRGPVVPSDDTLRAFANALELPVSEMHRALGRIDEYDDLDEHPAIDFLRGQPDAIKDKAYRMMQAAFAEEDEIDNDGNIGKKAE